MITAPGARWRLRSPNPPTARESTTLPFQVLSSSNFFVFILFYILLSWNTRKIKKKTLFLSVWERNSFCANLPCGPCTSYVSFFSLTFLALIFFSLVLALHLCSFFFVKSITLWLYIHTIKKYTCVSSSQSLTQGWVSFVSECLFVMNAQKSFIVWILMILSVCLFAFLSISYLCITSLEI